MGGGKRTEARTLPINFRPFQKSFWSAQSWIFVQEKQSNETRGGGKRTVRGGVPNPFLGGVSFVRVSSPLCFPPPVASPDQGHVRERSAGANSYGSQLAEERHEQILLENFGFLRLWGY